MSPEELQHAINAARVSYRDDPDAELRAWERIDAQIQRGRIVSLVARWTIATLIIATSFLLGFYGMPALWGRL